MKIRGVIGLIGLIGLLASPLLASAEVFNSTNFKLLEPVVNAGGFSTTNNYRLFGSIGQVGLGIGDSSNFRAKGGFLYFPAPSVGGAAAAAPAPTPTGGGPYLDIFKKFFKKFVLRCTDGDLNCDGQVDLYDAAILFYWWEKSLQQPNFASLLAAVLGRGLPSPDLNSDGIANIFDLSVMLSHWTGNGFGKGRPLTY